jgi:hypothetical protein
MTANADNLMQPIVNLNGTSPEALIEARMEARTACRALMNALGGIAPNGRDYIGHPDAYARDRAIYAARFVVIDKLFNELGDEALAIQSR